MIILAVAVILVGTYCMIEIDKTRSDLFELRNTTGGDLFYLNSQLQEIVGKKSKKFISKKAKKNGKSSKAKRA